MPVQTIPLEPELKWYSHQNGDWNSWHSNIICPPNPDKIAEERSRLLIPYIDYAYKWISNARIGKLTNPDERYEFPHIAPESRSEIFIEGGSKIFDWIRENSHGIAWIEEINSSFVERKRFIIKSLRGISQRDESKYWRPDIHMDTFGSEVNGSTVPWVFIGNPVVEKPHRPYVTWSDFSQENQNKILIALDECLRIKSQKHFVLLAFSVPEKWEGDANSIVWLASELNGVTKNIFNRKGFRPNTPLINLPGVKSLIKKNHHLKWGTCTDLSKEALLVRGKADMKSFEDLKIAILGVGAIGSVLAKSVSKLAPVKLFLADSQNVEPGNLIRHEALTNTVGMNKAVSMAWQLLAINSSIQMVPPFKENILTDWDELVKTLSDYDLIIDATANKAIHERLSSSSELLTKKIAWCFIKPGPDFGVLGLRQEISQRTFAELQAKLFGMLRKYILDQYHKSDEKEGSIVWPEPGCYHPTFNASYHRIRMMADTFLTTLVSWIEKDAPNDVITLYKQAERIDRFGIETQIESQVILK